MMKHKSDSEDFAKTIVKSEKLSDFYIQIAKSELNETEIRKEQSIKQFYEWFRKHPFIINCENEPFQMMSLIRARKYNMDKVYDSISKLVIIQQNLSQIMNFQNNKKLLEIYDKGACLVTKNYDSNGRRALIYRHKILEDLNVSIVDILELNHFVSVALTEEPETQICGIVLIHDYRDISINYMKILDMNVLLKVLPVGDIGALRLKQINVIGFPAIANSLFELVKTFMSDKMKNRINFCKNVKDLTKVMDVKNLTVEYGGTENTEDCIKNYRKAIEEAAIKTSKFFENIEVDLEKMRKYENEKNSEGVGSFRKLEID